MFPDRYYPGRFFANRYFPPGGDAVVASSLGGDPGYPKRKRHKKPDEPEPVVIVSEPENLQEEETEASRQLLEELEEIYDELHGIRKRGHEAVEREAARIVHAHTQQAETKPPKWLPPPSQMDFESLAADLEATKALIALYQAFVNDEEEAFFMLMIA